MPERGSQEDIDRHMKAMVGLGNGLSFRECVQGTYGDEESDYSEEEHEASDRGETVEDYYDTCLQDTIKLKGDENAE